MKKHHYTYEDVHRAATNICLKMYNDNWRPDYVVGITRGGLPLALRISQLLDCRMETLKVKLRDAVEGEQCESNCWMAEDAFGYVWKEDRDKVFGEAISDPNKKKKILVVDDINDTGSTFNWIREDWQSSCLPDNPNWDTVWNKNVKFAVMCEKTHTKWDGVDYIWQEIDTSQEDIWAVFPWEYEK